MNLKFVCTLLPPYPVKCAGQTKYRQCLKWNICCVSDDELLLLVC